MEDLTVMKLMEEIMELDQEIKMKQRWMASRMKMLHQMVPQQRQREQQRALTIEKFMLRLQPEYPKKISPFYDAIPLRQADVFSEPIELKMADVYENPIQMESQEMLQQEEKDQNLRKL